MFVGERCTYNKTVTTEDSRVKLFCLTAPAGGYTLRSVLVDTSLKRAGPGVAVSVARRGDRRRTTDRNPVDIERILAARAPEALKRLPPGVLHLVRLAAHESRVNARLNATGDLDPLEFCLASLRRLSVQLNVRHEEYLAHTARPVVCCNHPSGGLEGLAMIAAIYRSHGDCRIPANDLLRVIPPLAPLIIPVNRSQPTRAAAIELDRAFAGDVPILVFPAGVTARIYGGRLREYPWAATFVTRARRYDRPVVPVHASGRNSPHFYLIHQLRRVFGIRLNLEMFLLADELFRHQGDTITLTCLPPQRVRSGDGPRRERSEIRMADRIFAETLRRSVEAAGRSGGTHG